MIDIKMEVDMKNLLSTLKALPGNLEPAIQQTTRQFADDTAQAIRLNFMQKGTAAPRDGLASQIKVEGKDNVVAVTVPKKADWIDRAKPHYVSLKNNSGASKWTEKYFGTKVRSGRSKPLFTSGSRMGSKDKVIGGYLYVVPDPFVDEAFLGIYPRFEGMLKSSSEQAIQKSMS
jgi:hypothetical protein